MNNIEILEMQLKKIKDFCKDNKHYYPEELPYYMFWNGKQAEIVENLIKENKELKEEQLRKAGIYKIDIDFDSDYIPKSALQELLDIDEIDVVHCRLKRLLGDDN